MNASPTSNADVRTGSMAEYAGSMAERVGDSLSHTRRIDVGAFVFAKPTDNVPLGILWMIGATVLLAVAAAIAKWQTEFYPVGEVMFIRSLSGLIVCAALILPMSGLAVFATKRPGAHIARGVSQAVSQTFTVIAVSLMPLAGAVAISFSGGHPDERP